MPHVLHLIKSPVPGHALSVIQHQSRQPDTALTVVLVHGAVAPPLPDGIRIHRLAAPHPALSPVGGEDTGEGGAGTLTYEDLLDLIFTADQVISW